MKNLFFSLMVTLSDMFMNAQSYNIDPADYGRYHNEFVDLFEKSGRSFSNYTSYSAFLTDFQQIVNAKYPNFATNADIAQINSRFMTDIMNPQTM